MINDSVVSALILIGTFFTFLGSFGLTRMPDLYTRIHCVTKSATLGLVSLLIASAIHMPTGSVIMKVLLAIFFQFLTNPVGAHMIARAAYYHLKVPMWNGTVANEWTAHQQ